MIRKNIQYTINQWKHLSPEYKQFFLWSGISNIAASTQSVLANHSMLNCIEQDTTGNLLTMNYIAKDMIGQIGGIVYTTFKSKKIDEHSLKILNNFSILQQVSFFTESLTPLFPNYFLPIATTSNMANTIAYTGFGAINTKIIQFLTPNNMCETYTKITAINTISSSIGMLIGLGIITIIPDHSLRLCIVPIIGIVRLYTLKKSIKNIL